MGRKIFYSISLIASGFANLFTPILTSSFLGYYKSIREAASVTREIMRSVLLFENNKGRFLHLLHEITVWNFLAGSGHNFSRTTYRGFRLSFAFLIGALLLFIIYFVFERQFKEIKIFQKENGKMKFDLNDLITLNIPPKLKILAITNFVFTLGLSISHCFIMPLFLRKNLD